MHTRCRITLLLSAIWLTSCGDDGSDHPQLACDEAGCNSDGGASVEDASAIAADASDEPDAAPPADAAARTPEADAASAAVDAEVLDASAEDAASLDASLTDAGSPDSGTADAGAADTGAVDPGVVDSGAVDSGTPDTGTPDTGTPDTGTPDTGTPDANLPDTGPAFVPVRFSASDHGASVVLSPDRLSAENRGEEVGNARSDALIAAGSGVFYFEAERLIDSVGFWGIGVATASASLTGDLAANQESLGLFTRGEFADGNASCSGSASFDGSLRKYGIVVDYRAQNPRVFYLLEGGTGAVEVRHKCNTALTAPLAIFYAGVRYEVGLQIKINTGADTVNLPFNFSASQVRAALIAANEAQASAAIVFGFGKTRALPLSAAPVLSAVANRDLPAGSVTLTGTASDAEDGDLTNNIVWTDLSSQHHAQVTGSGGSFTFNATLGRHPVLMRVTDSVGRTTSQTVMVTATGSLPQANPVRLVADSLSGSNTTISSDGLSVDVHASTKNGVRCNQGIFGQFWYFEAQRNGVPNNEGVGLVIGDGNLNPYSFVNPPWSMSINLTGSTWYNLNSIGSFPQLDDHYGFAVDYRGFHPTVYVITGGVLRQTLVMKDVWGPIYPMAYGNPYYEPPTVDPGDDITLNFGATPFVYNPATSLGSLANGIEVGWGDANTTP